MRRVVKIRVLLLISLIMGRNQRRTVLYDDVNNMTLITHIKARLKGVDKDIIIAKVGVTAEDLPTKL